MWSYIHSSPSLYNVILVCAVVLLIALFLVMTFVFLTSSEPDLSWHDSEKYFTDPRDPTNLNHRLPFPSINDAASLDLTVVVPSYNEQERLPIMMDEALDYLRERQEKYPKFTYEIIIVDDGSRDDTTKVGLGYTAKYGPERVRVLTLTKNRGKGGAVRRGMLSGRGRSLMFADADGASRFADVAKLEAELLKLVPGMDDKMAVVCGSRAHLEKDSIAQRSVFRTFLMYVFHFLVWSLCVKEVKDTQCGFKLFTRSAARLLFTNMHVERWAFDIDLLYIAQHFKIPIAEVAIKWQEIPGSKLSPLWASIQMFRDLVLIRLRYMTGLWKMDASRKRV